MDEKGDKIIAFMLDWAKNYYKSRDAFHKNIKSIVEQNNCLEIEFKDKKEKVISCPSLELLDFNQFKDQKDHFSIIILNNRKNIDFLVDKWKSFSQIANLKVYFINPFSETDKKWIISPHIHSKVCDESSLKQGLVAMFETVEPLTEDMLIHKL